VAAMASAGRKGVAGVSVQPLIEGPSETSTPDARLPWESFVEFIVVVVVLSAANPRKIGARDRCSYLQGVDMRTRYAARFSASPRGAGAIVIAG